MIKSLIVCTLLFIVHNVFAQTEFKLFLRDGNIVSGTSDLNKVSLTTDFGKLEIPIKNVSSIELGIPPATQLASKIETLVKQLSNSDDQMRKSAYDELIKYEIGVIPVLNSIFLSENYTVNEYSDYTAEMALAELKNIHNLKDNYSEKDVIGIDYSYTMGGSFDFNKIDLKTAYGNLSVAKSKIDKIEITYNDPSNSKTKNFTLQASKHISSNANGGWLKTGITVKPGNKIVLTASGEIIFASLSGSKYKPNGAASSTANVDDYNDSFAGSSTYPSYGNVVFKIGDSGAVQKAGAKYNGNANGSGMLYISIYETVYNPANSGSYSVNVSVH